MKMSGRGCVVLDQPQRVGKRATRESVLKARPVAKLLRLGFATAALRKLILRISDFELQSAPAFFLHAMSVFFRTRRMYERNRVVSMSNRL